MHENVNIKPKHDELDLNANNTVMLDATATKKKKNPSAGQIDNIGRWWPQRRLMK